MDSNAPDTRRRLLRTDEAAARLGVTDETIRRMIAGGRLPGTKVGGRVMVHEDVIAKFEAEALSPGKHDMRAADAGCTMSAGRRR